MIHHHLKFMPIFSPRTMPAELRPSPDFFTDVRLILADARRAVCTANLEQ